MHRRHFLSLSTALAALPSGAAWAEAGRPDYLTAANDADNATYLLGLTRDGELRFALPIPARGHAAAAHPTRAEAVAFSRRPGRYATVIDCAQGREIARLESPEGRHFYGHGAYTADGAFLLTTENDFETPAGVLSVYDVAAGYTRIDELPSGGIGPHEIIRLASGGFAVANGGIQTHPSNDRARLNLPTMRPNLTWLDADGAITDQTAPPDAQRLNSIRHIAAAPDGTIVAALQWQGYPLDRVPLMARITAGGISYHDHPDTARLKNYGGSVAVSADGGSIAVTGPKGGYVLYFDGATGAPNGSEALDLASGAAPDGQSGIVLTCADGLAHRGAASGATRLDAVDGGWVFDNHLVPV